MIKLGHWEGEDWIPEDVPHVFDPSEIEKLTEGTHILVEVPDLHEAKLTAEILKRDFSNLVLDIQRKGAAGANEADALE